MILEEIDGDVKVVLNGKPLTVGSEIADAQYPLVSVIGKGKATFRVDPSCTLEVKGVEVAVEETPAPAPAPVKAAPAVKAVPAPEPTPEPAEKPAAE